MIDGLVRGPSLEATKAVCTQIVSVFVLAGIGDPGGLQQRGATVPTQLYTGRLQCTTSGVKAALARPLTGCVYA
jgi:hypothetical protein